MWYASNVYVLEKLKTMYNTINKEQNKILLKENNRNITNL